MSLYSPLRIALVKSLVLVSIFLFAALSFADSASAAVFAKYDGVDGESADANHDKWIDVLSIDWGAHQPGAATGQSRRRGGVLVEDLRLTMEYDKAAPRLQEKALLGEIIPKLEIEQTANYGGARATYLRYELKNVMITSFSTTASGNDESPPNVTIANNFEEIKITYTQYDETGAVVDFSELFWSVKGGGGGSTGE